MGIEIPRHAFVDAYNILNSSEIFFELFGDIKEDKTTPSCSLREALDRQGLCINPFMATIVMTVLWKMLTEHYIEKFQFFLNQETMQMI